MVKYQWISEITTSSTKSLVDLLNESIGEIKSKDGVEDLEIHQVIHTGGDNYVVIFNIYK